MTTEEKRKYLRAVTSGILNPGDFTDLPERHFVRLSPIKDEISAGDGLGGIVFNIDPSTRFLCKEDGIEYTWQQINNMDALSTHPIIYCSTTQGNEPFAVTEANVLASSGEERITEFLKQL